MHRRIKSSGQRRGIQGTRAVIFDVDGTLVDSVNQHAEAWRIALLRFGHDVTYAKIRRQIGKGGDQLMPVFLSPSEIRREGIRVGNFRDNLFRRHFLPGVRAFPKVRRLFLKLRASGWKIAIASSSNKKDLRILLEKCRISDLTDVVISADDAKKSKPHPDLFLAAQKKLQCETRDCVVIGDSPFDAKAAQRSKMRSVGVLSGGFSQNSLRSAGADLILRDPADILSRLGRLEDLLDM